MQTSSHHSDAVSQFLSWCLIAVSPGNQTSNALPDFELCVRLRSASHVFNHLLAEASLRPVLVSPPRCPRSSEETRTTMCSLMVFSSRLWRLDCSCRLDELAKLNVPAATCGCLPSIKEKMDQLDLKEHRQKPTFPGGFFFFFFLMGCHRWWSNELHLPLSYKGKVLPKSVPGTRAVCLSPELCSSHKTPKIKSIKQQFPYVLPMVPSLTNLLEGSRVRSVKWSHAANHYFIHFISLKSPLCVFHTSLHWYWNNFHSISPPYINCFTFNVDLWLQVFSSLLTFLVSGTGRSLLDLWAVVVVGKALNLFPPFSSFLTCHNLVFFVFFFFSRSELPFKNTPQQHTCRCVVLLWESAPHDVCWQVNCTLCCAAASKRLLHNKLC